MAHPNRQGPLIFVRLDGLRRLDARPSLRDYTKQIWSRRAFVIADSKAKAFDDTRDLRLGRFWLILRPALFAIMYGTLFGLLLKTSRGIENFPGFVLIGMTYFQFINQLFIGGTGILKFSRNLISSFKFPRATLVMSHSIKKFIDAIPAAIMSVVIALLFQWNKPVHWTLVIVPIVFVLAHLFGTGLMFIVARQSAFLEDVKEIFKFLTMPLMFVSGILFSIDRYATNPTVHAILYNNPFHLFVEAVRNAALYGGLPTSREWLTMCAWAFITLAVGYVYFWQAEERYVSAQ